MIGTRTMMNQAPWVNFVMAMMMRTRKDNAAPTALTKRP